jgi:hypothetical protein
MKNNLKQEAISQKLINSPSYLLPNKFKIVGLVIYSFRFCQLLLQVKTIYWTIYHLFERIALSGMVLEHYYFDFRK